MKTYGLWRPVMNGAWKAPITLPIQKQTTHTTATFYTTADYMVHYASGATKSKLHHSVLQSYSSYESPTYQEPFNNSSPYGRDLAAQTRVYSGGSLRAGHLAN